MSENAMLDAALAYIDQGFKIFPLNGKVPATKHGFKDATQTQLGVREIWGQSPTLNIGLVTQDFVVIDFDVKSGGKESKIKMWAEHGALPKTRVHKTGGGGQHWIYSNPYGIDVRNSTSFAGYSGVDIRANGGYIVAPPSVHPDTGIKYEVVDPSPVVTVPDWVLDAAGKKSQNLSEPFGEDLVIPEKQRNATLASLAGTMRRRGMGEETILAALLTANEKQCSPPLDESEVRTIAKSVSRYQPDPLAQLTDKTDILDIAGVSTDKTDISDITDSSDKTDLSDTPDIDQTFQTGEGLVKKLVARWLSFHKGERFDLDTICRQLDISNRDLRHFVVKKLSYEVSAGNLEKSVLVRPPIYTYTNKDIKIIDWINATDSNPIPLNWPYGHEDGSRFGFDGAVQIFGGDIIVIAGVSNTGKTALALNLVVENMDDMRVSLQGNEYVPGKFHFRMGRMTWANPLKEDGTPKFELIDRHDNWADIIRPDNLNIIDWLNLDGTSHPFYEIGSIVEGIQRKLKNGVAVICIQKDANKDMGMGGGFSQHLASLYLAIDFMPDKHLKMTVKKAKSWTGHNPNHEMYAFDLVEAGTLFHKIHRIKKCLSCGGRGNTRMGAVCDLCSGSGHIKVPDGDI